jgi:serine protease AprX
VSSNDVAACPLCQRSERASVLAEAAWIDDDTEARIRSRNTDWRRRDGACPACVQQALLALLLEKGERVLGRVVQDVWPLDPEAAFGALPTPLRVRADPRFTGVGVTVAVIDAAFYPHDDLVRPSNRIRAWVDASEEALHTRHFAADDVPNWPGSALGTAAQWHGLMTSAALAGNGWRSHGLYRGLAPDASLVLVQVQGDDGRIGSTRLVRALRWILAHHREFGIRVVNASLGVGAESADAERNIDTLIAALVADGVSVVVASGNDGQRSLALPASSPFAITVGGLDDGNTFDTITPMLWHSNFGVGSNGRAKPELVAPSIWIVAPIIPVSELAGEAIRLFERRALGDASAETRIRELRLVTPHYQHVEGTSFASPIVSSVVACMREAYPALHASATCALLEGACYAVAGATPERQGAGAIDAGHAVAAALALSAGSVVGTVRSPRPDDEPPTIWLRDFRARSVRIVGSWDDWHMPGIAATLHSHGLWCASPGSLEPGVYHYKLLLDDSRWIADPSNPERVSDGLGGWNSVLRIGS